MEGLHTLKGALDSNVWALKYTLARNFCCMMSLLLLLVC
jgi:hypothetical protein